MGAVDCAVGRLRACDQKPVPNAGRAERARTRVPPVPAPGAACDRTAPHRQHSARRTLGRKCVPRARRRVASLTTQNIVDMPVDRYRHSSDRHLSSTSTAPPRSDTSSDRHSWIDTALSCYRNQDFVCYRISCNKQNLGFCNRLTGEEKTSGKKNRARYARSSRVARDVAFALCDLI